MSFLKQILANAIDSIANEIESLSRDKKFLKRAVADAKGNDYWPDADDLEGNIKDRLRYFSNDFQHRAEQDGNELVIWRRLDVDDKEKFINLLKAGNTDRGLGSSWSFRYDKNMPAPGGKMGNRAQNIIIKAKIPISSIDVAHSCFLALDERLFEDEKELRIKKGAKLTIVDILDSKGDSLLDGAKEFPAIAKITARLSFDATSEKSCLIKSEKGIGST